ncbi:MAG: D-2-hydroxyacid dehydrogenase [Desulforhopalus sp.]|nr:D-2-hydroxyacid dehydrogenase [Desulforhopalus sp.]
MKNSTRKIVFLDAETIPEHISPPSFNFPHEYTSFQSTTEDEIIQRATQAEIIMTNKVPLRRECIAHLPELKMIAVTATGYDIIDLDACRERGIIVCNVQNYAETSVPEHVIAMIFALRRNLLTYHKDVMAGEWSESRQFCFLTHPIGDIAGCTIGIIGSGSLGSAVGKMAVALGMKVLFGERRGATSIREGFHPFETLLKTADIITLHCPLNNSTRGLIGANELAMMKENAILINAARGGLVDEAALADTLRAGRIGGAGIDVLSTEPPTAGNPLLDPTLPQLIVTPHIAWGADSAITNLIGQVVENINRYAEGAPVRQVG